MKCCLKGLSGGIAELDWLSVDLTAAEHLSEIDTVLLDLLHPAPELHCHPMTDGTGSGEWDAVPSRCPGWEGCCCHFSSDAHCSVIIIAVG